MEESQIIIEKINRASAILENGEQSDTQKYLDICEDIECMWKDKFPNRDNPLSTREEMVACFIEMFDFCDELLPKNDRDVDATDETIFLSLAVRKIKKVIADDVNRLGYTTDVCDILRARMQLEDFVSD